MDLKGPWLLTGGEWTAKPSLKRSVVLNREEGNISQILVRKKRSILSIDAVGF